MIRISGSQPAIICSQPAREKVTNDVEGPFFLASEAQHAQHSYLFVSCYLDFSTKNLTCLDKGLESGLACLEWGLECNEL